MMFKFMKTGSRSYFVNNLKKIFRNQRKILLTDVYMWQYKTPYMK